MTKCKQILLNDHLPEFLARNLSGNSYHDRPLYCYAIAVSWPMQLFEWSEFIITTEFSLNNFYLIVKQLGGNKEEI